MGVGMGRDQRRRRDRRHVVEALGVEVREVDEDAQLVAGPDQLAPERRQPRPGVGVARIAERHAVPEDRRPAPDRPERAQPRRMQEMERIEIGPDRLGALHVHHRRDAVPGHGRADLRGRAADRSAPPDTRSIRKRMPAMASATGCASAAGMASGSGRS